VLHLLPHHSTNDRHCQDTTCVAVRPEGAPSYVALRKASLPIHTHSYSHTASALSHNLHFFPSYKLAYPIGTEYSGLSVQLTTYLRLAPSLRSKPRDRRSSTRVYLCCLVKLGLLCVFWVAAPSTDRAS
jgi:hypothetical protein